MAMIAAHNLPAMNANRQNQIIERNRAKAAERLASGYRINRAADDASGLAISEKMRAQIRGLKQASRNIQDGISYVQVADGALQEVHSIFQRIRQIAVQASNGTNTPDDRFMLDMEVEELKEDAERIFRDTEFNTQKIWSGEPRVVETIIGTTKVSAVTASYPSVTSTITNTNRFIMPKSSFRLDAGTDGIRVSWTAYDGNTYTSELIEYGEPYTGVHSFHLKDYLNKVTYTDKATGSMVEADPKAFEGLDFAYTYSVEETAGLSEVVSALNGKTVSNYISTPESAKAYAADGTSLIGKKSNGDTLFTVSYSADINYNALLVSDRDFENADTVYIEGVKNGSSYENVSNNPFTKGKPAEAYEFEFLLKTGTDAAGNDTFTTVRTKPSYTEYYCSTRDDDDKGIWWYEYTSQGHTYTRTYTYSSSPLCSPDAVSNAYAASHSNKTRSETLLEANKDHTVTIRYAFNLVADQKFTCKDGSETTSVGSISFSLTVRPGATADEINKVLGEAIRGLDIDAPNSRSTLTARNNSWSSANKVEIPTYEPRYEYVKQLDIQAGANEGQMIPIEYDMLSLSLLDIEDISVDTFESAQKTLSLEKIDGAIRKISEQRSLFGAYQNRLEHAGMIDDNTAENLQAAESQIRDADMAASVVEYSRAQILSQTAQSMLAQANQSTQNILNLLQ